MNKLKFSGHETFIVRSFWPQKGYDFVINGGNFSSEDAVIKLGVGKNMVSSINFWMKALGLIDEGKNKPTEIANFIFSENGVDPFLEDIGSIWLLHYLLVSSNYSSIYYLVFNELRKERSVFNKGQLLSFIKRRYSETEDNSYNKNTVEKDISVFLRLYNRVDYRSISKDFEDEISSLMIELNLINSSIEEEIKEGSNKREKIEWYYLHGVTRENLPPEIVLFTILDNFQNSNNISLKRLEIEPNSPGMIFLLSRDALYGVLKEIEKLYPGIVLSETAGNTILVLPEAIDKWKVLKKYYAV
jgi:hypothetical protein